MLDLNFSNSILSKYILLSITVADSYGKGDNFKYIIENKEFSPAEFRGLSLPILINMKKELTMNDFYELKEKVNTSSLLGPSDFEKLDDDVKHFAFNASYFLNDVACSVIENNLSNNEVIFNIFANERIKNLDTLNSLPTELFSDKRFVMLAITSYNIRPDNAMMIGEALRNDKEVMMLLTFSNYPANNNLDNFNKCKTIYDKDLWKDKNFLLGLCMSFRPADNRSGAIDFKDWNDNLPENIVKSCEEAGIDIDRELLQSVFDEARSIEWKNFEIPFQNRYSVLENKRFIDLRGDDMVQYATALANNDLEENKDIGDLKDMENKETVVDKESKIEKKDNSVKKSNVVDVKEKDKSKEASATLATFVSLYGKYLSLVAMNWKDRANSDDNLEALREELLRVGADALRANFGDKEIAYQVLNYANFFHGGDLFAFLSDELQNDKNLASMAIASGLSSYNFDLIGKSLRKDKSVMILLVHHCNSLDTLNATISCCDNSLLRDEDFLANLFAICKNQPDYNPLDAILHVKDKYGIDIDKNIVISAFKKSESMNYDLYLPPFQDNQLLVDRLNDKVLEPEDLKDLMDGKVVPIDKNKYKPVGDDIKEIAAKEEPVVE